VDIDPASISKTVHADVPIVGPVDSVLREMLQLVNESDTQPDEEALKAWWKQIREWGNYRGRYYYEKNDEHIMPQEAIEALYRVTKGDAYVTSDVGQHQMFAAQYYPLTSRTAGSIPVGWGPWGSGSRRPWASSCIIRRRKSSA